MKEVIYTKALDGQMIPLQLYNVSSQEYKISTAIAELEALKTMLESIRQEHGDIDVVTPVFSTVRVDNLDGEKFATISTKHHNATT